MAKTNVTQDELEYFNEGLEIVEPKKEVSRARSLAGALPKGVLKQTGKMLGQISEAAENIPIFGEPLKGGRYRADPKEKQKEIEQLFPTQDRFSERSLERGGEILPFMFTGGPATTLAGVLGQIGRSVAAGFMGQGAQEMGFGPIGQMIAELPAFLSPNLSRMIPARGETSNRNLARMLGVSEEEVSRLSAEGRDAELLNFAREQGLSEEQIALLTGDRGVVRDFMQDTAAKGGRSARAVEETRRGLGGIWDNMFTRNEASIEMSGEQAANLYNSIQRRLLNLPAESRNRIQEDFADLIRSDGSMGDLMNFWQDINYYINQGERGLGILKEDILRTMRNSSPELARDFELANELYRNFGDAVSRIRPDILESLIKTGERGLVVRGVMNRDLSALQKALGLIGGRQLALEMVKNPRFQRLSERMINAMSNSRYGVAKSIFDKMTKEVSKTNAKAAREMANFDWDEIFNEAEED